jgi:hypothetical protein
VRRVRKLPPALKHEIYSAITILPGESPAAFAKLRRDLIAEWAPSGPLEHDKVETIARLLWRKQNPATFRIAERARAHCRALKRKKGLELDLLPFPMDNMDPVRREAAQQAAEEEARKELGDLYELVEAGEAATLEGLQNELAIQEQLDGMIYEQVKQLMSLKSFKSMLPSSSSTSTPRPRIVGPQQAA